MYYLYLITNLKGRPGFGITSNPRERNKQYCSHTGDIVKFTYLYGGLRTHAKAVERTIKIQFVDNAWIIDDWQTEWMKDGITMDDLKSYVDQLINDRHYRIQVVETDYDFRSDTIG